MKRHRAHALGLVLASLAISLPAHAGESKLSDSGSASGADAAAAPESGDATAEPGAKPAGHKGHGGKHLSVTPYIEAMQIATAELSPDHEFLTYSVLAVGVDANVQGRNTHAAASLRYERRFGYGKSNSGDSISGVARVATTVVPHAVNLEAGVLAARTKVEESGSVVLGTPVSGGGSTQVYSLYAGPTVHTHAGDVGIDGGYRIGYTKVGTDSSVASAPGGPALDVFDHSVVHDAEIHAGTKAGTVLPVGIGAGAGFYQESISNLDQRVRDFHARADVEVPVTSDVHLVGGVGYESVQISARDALRDGLGNPVVGANGRYVTDKSSPRVIAYDTSGLIWDAGVLWRPSHRTALEAHVGRRYGSTSFYGSFGYKPNSRTSINISVYDNVAGFGGQLNKALAGVPTDFEASRNPLSGEMNGCLVSLEKGNCLSGALGSVRSATFRARGVMASYAVDLGRIKAGVGVGYDRRKFIAAPGTVLAFANGVTDQNYWLSGYVNARLDARSHLATNVFADWFKSGFGSADDGTALGASAAYYRTISDHLTATAALGIDGINRKTLPDSWDASALVGVRYAF